MAQAKHTSITRRRLVAASAAVIPAVTAPFSSCAKASFDPIFTAIEAHRRAYTDVLALLDRQAAADRVLQQMDGPMRAALQAHLHALCEAEGPLGLTEMEASARLAATVPATLPGVAAVLRHARLLFERDNYALYEDDGYRALLFSTERAIERFVSV